MANANKKAAPDPRLARDACFKCGSKLIATSEEVHETAGKSVGVPNRWGYGRRAASGKPTTHRILRCPSCRKVRAVDAGGNG